MAEPESQLFRKTFGRLHESIKPEVDQLTIHLYAASVVGETVRDEVCSGGALSPCKAATKLLTAVESKIKTQPSQFDTFLQVLKTCPPLKELADELDAEIFLLRSPRVNPEPESGWPNRQSCVTTTHSVIRHSDSQPQLPISIHIEHLVIPTGATPSPTTSETRHVASAPVTRILDCETTADIRADVEQASFPSPPDDVDSKGGCVTPTKPPILAMESSRHMKLPIHAQELLEETLKCRKPLIHTQESLEETPMCTKPPIHAQESMEDTLKCTKPLIHAQESLEETPMCMKPPIHTQESFDNTTLHCPNGPSSLSSTSSVEEDMESLKGSLDTFFMKYRKMEQKLKKKRKQVQSMKQEQTACKAYADAVSVEAIELSKKLESLQLQNAQLEDNLADTRESLVSSNLQKQRIIDQMKRYYTDMLQYREQYNKLQAQVKKISEESDLFAAQQRSESKIQELESEIERMKELERDYKERIELLELEIEVLVTVDISSVGDVSPSDFDWESDMPPENSNEVVNN